MTEKDYNIQSETKFPQLEVIDVPSIVSSTKEKWINYALNNVNDDVVRLAIIEGEFHWHKHEDEDEFFFVLEGKLFIEVEEDGAKKMLELNPMQGVTIPKGVVHCPRAPQKTVVLLFEKGTTKLTGN